MQKEEKITIFFLIACIIIVIVTIVSIYTLYNKSGKSLEEKIAITRSFGGQTYEVYQNNKLIEIFDNYDKALKYAKKYENSSIKKTGDYRWVYDSIPPYEVYQNYTLIKVFANYNEALAFAKNYENAYIFYRKTNTFIWNNALEVPSKYIIYGVPNIAQYPELKRGCEVTSLAMMLNYKGVAVSKLELAENIKKEPFLFDLDGRVYNGNPHIGFVGDIYTFNKDGYGVYNEPLYNLLKEYIGEDALNLTGSSLKDLYYYIANNRPVVIITNTMFEKLSSNYFETLNTTRGEINMTYKEHSVVIIGYDSNYIYFNDPIYKEKISRKPINDFEKAYNQMGRQAITYVP